MENEGHFIEGRASGGMDVPEIRIPDPRFFTEGNAVASRGNDDAGGFNQFHSIDPERDNERGGFFRVNFDARSDLDEFSVVEASDVQRKINPFENFVFHCSFPLPCSDCASAVSGVR